MNTVPYKFWQSIAALLREPKQAQRASYVFSDALWTETLQTEWEKREYVDLILRKQQGSSWQYGFECEQSFDGQTVSSDVIVSHPNLAHLRIEHIGIFDNPQYEGQELFELKPSLADFVNSFRFMIPSSLPCLHNPKNIPPVLNIWGQFDEKTDEEIANVFHKIKFVDLFIKIYKPAFDPILNTHLQKNWPLEVCTLGDSSIPSVFASSTMNILRCYFRESKVFSCLELFHNPPFPFADFEAIFENLLEMPFSFDQMADDEHVDEEFQMYDDLPRSYTIIEANFDEDAEKQLSEFRPDLVHQSDDSWSYPDYRTLNRWTKDDDTCIQAQVSKQHTNSWMIQFIEVKKR
ncbi:hypothetical protein L596_016675 [Steinernema carpocapsae]|uniref:Uncharacterized protein n=1 Tax=Steinernema carpocapsae TaxID=34508 RepID=A0A4U5NIR4_STECR|nr:hypothetical protein L596_016675 [Steinernema carpocapsae]